LQNAVSLYSLSNFNVILNRKVEVYALVRVEIENLFLFFHFGILDFETMGNCCSAESVQSHAHRVATDATPLLGNHRSATVEPQVVEVEIEAQEQAQVVEEEEEKVQEIVEENDEGDDDGSWSTDEEEEDDDSNDDDGKADDVNAWLCDEPRQKVVKDKTKREVLVSECFACTVVEFFKVLIDSAEFNKRYRDKRGDRQLTIDPWEATASMGKIRVVRCISPVNAPIGPNETRNCETQQYALGVGELNVYASSQVPDVTFGDCFSVESVWHVVPADKAGFVRLTLNVGVHFSKSTMFKGKIQKQTVKESQRSLKMWAALAHERLKEYREEQRALAADGKKPRRRRRRRHRRRKRQEAAAQSGDVEETITVTNARENRELFVKQVGPVQGSVAAAASASSASAASSSAAAQQSIATRVSLAHEFASTTFKRPHWCVTCCDFIVGAWRQGKRCKVCWAPVHHGCAAHTQVPCPGERRGWRYWYAKVRENRERMGASVEAMAFDEGDASIANDEITETEGVSDPDEWLDDDDKIDTDAVAVVEISAPTAPAKHVGHVGVDANGQVVAENLPAEMLKLLADPNARVHRRHVASDFRKKTFKRPSYCYACNGFIAGIAVQGKRCNKCSMPVHHKCVQRVLDSPERAVIECHQPPLSASKWIQLSKRKEHRTGLD
jgi:VAD1 Analog of StAR-related lipid transfer domain/Phorbol esters/diacylglycerol binding domain (C1 domain)